MRTLPIFPLGLVVFPQEELNLHIFEPRYKQLISECDQLGITFGITAFIDNKLKDFGTEVRLKEIVNTYPDGRMDVRTEGVSPFRIQKFYKILTPKLYAGADVTDFAFQEDSVVADRILLVEKVSRLFDLMDVNMDLPIESEFLSFKIGHEIGLTLDQEYYLLTLSSEAQRIRFILDHLTRAIPVMQEMERTKQRIRMNGHFKHFDPLNF